MTERNFINFVITELDDDTFSNVLNSGEPVAEYYRNRWWLPLLKLKNENKLPRYSLNRKDMENERNKD